MNTLKIVKIFNAILWIILGILIAIWILFNNEILELIIWIGFALGCILIGILELINLSKISDGVSD